MLRHDHNFFTLHPDALSMHLDDPFYNCQSYSGTCCFWMEFFKGIKNPFMVAGINANSIIADIKNAFIFIVPMSDFYPRISNLIGEFCSIYQQIL
jgi:hypothetical protein